MSRITSPPIKLEGHIIADTGKALLIQVITINGYGHGKSVDPREWIPLSQVSKICRAAPTSNELDWIHASAWIVGQKGLKGQVNQGVNNVSIRSTETKDVGSEVRSTGTTKPRETIIAADGREETGPDFDDDYDDDDIPF